MIATKFPKINFFFLPNLRGCPPGLPGWRFFMPTFSNLAYCKVVGSKKNHLLAFQPKVPKRDFYCQPIQNMPNLRKMA